MELKEQQPENLHIPQTISNDKKALLFKKLLSTFLGFGQTNIISYPLDLTLWVLVLAAFIILKFANNNYGVMIAVVQGVCIAISLIYTSIHRDQVPFIWHRFGFASFYGYLWSHQLYYCHDTQLITLTLISIALSIGPMIFGPVPEIASPSLFIAQFNIHSIRYIRILQPLPLFIVQLTLDYGNYLQANSKHLYFIRLALSLVFITWIMGWVSTIYNTYYFWINNFNKFLFGDENKSNLSAALIAMLFNCVPIAIYLGWAENSFRPYWILWIGSSITSIILFLFQYFTEEKFIQNQSSFSCRIVISLITQILICGGLVVVLLVVSNFNYTSIKVITIIDVALYIFFQIMEFLSVPRNSFGLKINIQILNNQYVRFIKKSFLRASAGLVSIIIVQNLNLIQLWTKLSSTQRVSIDFKYVQYFFIPFLLYRTFKRSLSASNTFSFHISVLICLVLTFCGFPLEGILAILFFPPLPNNFLMVFLSPFTTPKKLKQKMQGLWILLYLVITMFSLCIHILSLGMLEFSMIFGLPAFGCIIPSVIQQGQQIKSKQHSLYEKIIQYIPKQLFRFKDEGFYLIRISKYIVLTELREQMYGFGEIINFKGLQVQQVTSCHSKEGETIDKIVEENWGDNTSECCNLNHLWTVLSPLKKSIINVPTQNQIQLTGIVESKQFILLFKSTVLKSLAWQISKIKYSQKQLADGQQILSDLSPICKIEKYQSLFPFEFAKEIGLEHTYPEASSLNKIISVKNKNSLPPLKNTNKKQMVDDFLDLIMQTPGKNQSEQIKQQTSTHHLNVPQLQQSSPKDKNADDLSSPKNSSTGFKRNAKELNVALIMTLYHYSVGKFDYLNIKKLYDQIKMEKGELSQVNFENAQLILSRALSQAFKISIDKMTMGQTDVNLQDFEDYHKSAYLGVPGTDDFSTAVSNDIEDIWTLSYGKGKLSIKRLAKSENDLYMFKADSCIITSIWNNLKFQLMYATNDNDERYSIQTHPSLMRNLWTQACEEPFGYPSYNSGCLVIN